MRRRAPCPLVLAGLAAVGLVLVSGCQNDLGLFWDPPVTPTPLVQTPPQAVTVSANSTGITVSWLPVNETAVTGYNVYDGTGSPVASVGVGQTAAQVTGQQACAATNVLVRTAFTDELGAPAESTPSPALSTITVGDLFACGPGYTRNGQAGDGLALAAGGDLDFDGGADFYLGAPNQQRVYIIETAGAGVPSTETPITSASAGFGEAVAYSTSDGVLLLGLPAFGGGQGRIEVRGPSGGLVEILNGGVGQAFGAAVAVGDVDGNGIDEAIWSDTAGGLVNVGPQLVLMTPQVAGPATPGFGGVLVAGDLDGVAGAEIVVGSPTIGVGGEVDVIQGTADIATSLTLNQTTVDANAEFGAAVAIADVNSSVPGDEIVVGAPAGSGSFGRIDLYDATFGGAPTLTAAGTLTGPDVGSAFGSSIANLGDIDGDGDDDLAVGAPGLGGQGMVYIVAGSPTGPQLAGAIAPVAGALDFGRALLSVGDVDNDGRNDLVVSGTTGGDTFLFLQLPANPASPQIQLPSVIGTEVGAFTNAQFSITSVRQGLTCTIDWGDFTTQTTACGSGLESFQHTYFSEGTYEVTLSVVDDLGHLAAASTIATVEEPTGPQGGQ